MRVELGGSGLTALNAAGGSPTVVKSPGVPFDAPLMRVARRRQLTVIDELELGWRMGSASLVGVTGTNGKSTSAMLIAAILESAGLRAPVVGNADYGQPLTAAPADADVLVCEVSSYQLEGCPAFVPEMAVFTNLTHDHLHRHGSLRRYGELKRRMFVRGDSATTVGVLNVDDPLGHRLAHDLGTAAGARVIGYGTNPAATYRIESCEWTAHAGQVTLATPAGRLVVESPLTGEHNARNTAAALATAAALGVDVDVAAAAVARARPLPGRFEPVVDAPFDVIVDNAGNPDAITACLGTARGIADQRRGRVHAVIGPGGGILDLEKRRAGARAACALADRIVMSSAGSFGQWLSPPLLAAVGAAREAGGGAGVSLL